MKNDDIEEFLNILDSEDVGGGNYEKRRAERKDCKIALRFMTLTREGKLVEDAKRNAPTSFAINISKTGLALETSSPFYVGDKIYCETSGTESHLCIYFEIMHFQRQDKGMFKFGCRFIEVKKIN